MTTTSFSSLKGEIYRYINFSKIDINDKGLWSIDNHTIVSGNIFDVVAYAFTQTKFKFNHYSTIAKVDVKVIQKDYFDKVSQGIFKKEKEDLAKMIAKLESDKQELIEKLSKYD